MDKIFTDEQVDSIIQLYNLQNNPTLRSRLEQGLESDLQQIKIKEDEYRTGKLLITKDNTGNPHIVFNFKEQNLNIPNKILDKELTEEDKKALLNGKTILHPKSNTGPWVGIQIDKELNKVVLKSEKQLGIIKEINGYKLSLDEQKELFDTKTLGTKVFYDKKRDIHYSASIQIGADGKTIEFLNPTQLSKEEAKELENKLNAKENLVLQSLSDSTIITNDQDKKPTIVESIADSKITSIQQTVTEKKEMSEIDKTKLISDLLSKQTITDNDLAKLKDAKLTINEFKGMIANDRFKELPVATQKAITLSTPYHKALKEEKGKQIEKKDISKNLQKTKTKSKGI